MAQKCSVKLSQLMAVSAGLNTPWVVVLIPAAWIVITQGIKRSHDLGNSGWYILIPFYGLWLIFAEGQAGTNKYGPNPKGESAPVQ
jgi:uncharacterized membrane protein YhaH (DUF805 family)